MTTRILHVVGGMNRGGVETWLMHVLRNINRERYQFDFLVHTEQACAYDDEIRALGSNIIPCLHPAKPVQYARQLRRILREYGPYDAVHSHVHHFSGLVLAIAQWAGVPVRIAHSHSDTSAFQAQAGLVRRLYLQSMNLCIQRYATHKLAASRLAASALFGQAWSNDAHCQILYCGIDLQPFQQALEPSQIRTGLNIPIDAWVIGHVGRFSAVKNHAFLVDIAVEIIKRVPQAVFLLVGDGPLRSEIEQKVTHLGLSQHFVFAGLRNDIADLMLGAMDVFLFPSLYEGLPLTLLEAQSAGLSCIISDVIAQEVDIIPSLIHRQSLQASAVKWAESLLQLQSKRITSKQAVSLIEDTPFSIKNSWYYLKTLYKTE